VLEITRRVNGERKTFRVWEKGEAEREGLRFRPWRECEQGDWALTDDGFVGECLDARVYTHHSSPRKFLKFSFAYAWASDPRPLSFQERFATRSFTRTSAKSWVQAELQKGRAKRVIRYYVQMLLAGKIDWDRLARLYRPTQKVPIATLKRFFRQKEVQMATREEVETLMREEGITERYVLRNYKRAIEMAEAKNDPRTIHEVATTLAELLQMFPQKNKIVRERIETVEVDAQTSQALLAERDAMRGYLDAH
jgi:hypothetical protein